MLYTLLAVVIILISAYIAYRALRVLARGSWIVGWLRGMFGLVLLLVAVIIGLVAFDIYRYKQIMLEEVIATIDFKKIENQHFEAVLVDSKGTEQRYNLHGDQWQLDARVVKLKGYLSTFGLRPGYRLERISGRYYDLEQEHKDKRTVYALNESLYGVDVWQWINKYPRWVPIMDAVYGSATYLPMADGALYEVSLSHTGLLARPLNAAAEEAINTWR
jgi:hypothetical protein